MGPDESIAAKPDGARRARRVSEAYPSSALHQRRVVQIAVLAALSGGFAPAPAAMAQAADAPGDAPGDLAALWDMVLAEPSVALPALLAAGAAALFGYLGGFFGARRRASAGPTRRAAAPRAERETPRQDGMLFPGSPGEADAAPPREHERELAEGRRLFSFLEDRFGLSERSADAAIDFFNRLSDAIDGLQSRADAAERAAQSSSVNGANSPAAAGAVAGAAAAGAGASTGEAINGVGASEMAAWRMISDGLRLSRGVLQRERGAEAELDRFERALDLEEAFVGLAALRAEQLQPTSDGAPRPLDPRIIEEAWPHALFRAEALLATYYPGAGAWGDLREGLSLITAALRRLLRAAGVSVATVTLLAPYNEAEGERWSDTAAELTGLERVRARLAGAAAREEAPFVIDCETFGYHDGARGVGAKSRLILLDPSEWR
ncbi:MAG: hypothetical protein AAF909_10665 [Pseudomonadota bacterium]